MSTTSDVLDRIRDKLLDRLRPDHPQPVSPADLSALADAVQKLTAAERNLAAVPPGRAGLTRVAEG